MALGIALDLFAIRNARGRSVLAVTLWIFEEGLLMERGAELSAVPYEQVVDFQANRETGRPMFWLTLKDDVQIVLSVGNTPEIMPVMEYIEIRMAAAQLLPRLRSIWHGKAEEFGVLVLNRGGIEGPGFFAPWPEVRRVVDDGTTVFIDSADAPKWLDVHYRRVSFPSLVMAISHVLIEEHSRLAPTFEPEA